MQEQEQEQVRRMDFVLVKMKLQVVVELPTLALVSTTTVLENDVRQVVHETEMTLEEAISERALELG